MQHIVHDQPNIQLPDLTFIMEHQKYCYQPSPLKTRMLPMQKQVCQTPKSIFYNSDLSKTCQYYGYLSQTANTTICHKVTL